MEQLIKPYELSVWEDVLDGERFIEKKIAVIGSNSMNGPWRANNITLTKNINGSSSLSFTMYYNYYNPETEQREENPMFKYLSNERKLKLHYMGEWLTFIIKERQESSSNHSYTFKAEDLFITELSKNGYNLEFDTELMNNQGTATELVEKILEGSDWVAYTEDDKDFFAEKIKEPLFRVSQVLTDGETIELETEALNGKIEPYGSTDFSTPKHIFVYYSVLSSQPSFFQCLVVEDDEIIVDDNNIITNGKFGYIKDVSYTTAPSTSVLGVNSASLEIEPSKFKGERLSNQQKSVYDADIGQYVDVYKKDGQTYYGYVKTTYDTSEIVSNFILEGQKFAKATGPSSLWSSPDTSVVNVETFCFIDLDNNDTFLRVKGAKNAQVINQSFYHNFANIFQIIPNANSDKVFDTGVSIVGGTKLVAKMEAFSSVDVDPVKYERATGKYISIVKQSRTSTSAEWADESVLCEFSFGDSEDYCVATVIETIDVNDVKDNTTTRVIFKVSASEEEYYIRDIEVFYYYEKEDGSYIVPGEVVEGKVVDNYYYYIPGQPDGAYISREADASYIPQYWNYEAVRTIDGSKSNRFNLIQNVCEKFDCWARFEIPVDEETGQRDYSKPKVVKLCHFIGKENYAGFKYGINLDAVQRTLNSSQLTTKLIVNDNSCEFGKNGFCSIARAEDNPTKSNFILNFDYFISQGLLSEEDITKDLYDLEEVDWGDPLVIGTDLAKIPKGYLASYEKLNRYFEKYNQEQTAQSLALTHLDSTCRLDKNTIDSAQTSIDKLKSELFSVYGYTYDEIISGKKKVPEDTLYAAYEFHGMTITRGGNPIWVFPEDYTNTETYVGNNQLIAFSIPEDTPEKWYDWYNNWFIIGRYIENKYWPSIYCSFNEEPAQIPEILIFDTDKNMYKFSLQDVYDDDVSQLTDAGYQLNHLILEEGEARNIKEMYMSGIEKSLVSSNTYYDADGNEIPGETITSKEQFENLIKNVGIYYDISDYSKWEQKSHPVQKTINEIKQFENDITVAQDELAVKEPERQSAQDKYDNITLVMRAIDAKLRELDKQFFSKYSRFIQEGTWQSDDYYDDNLYYYEALNVSNTSAYPDTQYSIKVYEISEVEGFEPYLFDVGDKTYIEDTEFFGWIWINGIKTPRKQDVIISAITYTLDNPSANSITVQNYNTQFESLFQRIAAATQNVEYKSGQYQRAANVVNKDGTISSNVIQNSLDNGNIVLSNSFADSITWDKEGFTVTNVGLPTEKIRITTTGISFSTDGGNTWASAITSDGVKPEYLEDGKINITDISVFDGLYNTFRWDTNGITAYSYDTLNSNRINKNKFVRFDRFGTYGVDNESFEIPEDSLVENQLAYIEDNANFGLVWNKFFLKTDRGDGQGMVKISSDDDFQVLTYDADGNAQERIKIGDLGDHYGMTIRDSEGIENFRTTDEGKIELSVGRVILDENGLTLKDEEDAEKLRIGKLEQGENEYYGFRVDGYDEGNLIPILETTRTGGINIQNKTIQLDDTGMTINKVSKSNNGGYEYQQLAKYGENIVIGPTNQRRMEITARGIELYASAGGQDATLAGAFIQEEDKKYSKLVADMSDLHIAQFTSEQHNTDTAIIIEGTTKGHLSIKKVRKL